MDMNITDTSANLSLSMSLKPLDTIFARIGRGQRKGGVERGPDCLWEHGVEKALGDASILTRNKPSVSDHEIGLMPALAELADVVEQTARSGHRPLTLGGDHSIALSTIEGMLRVYPDLRVVYIDAHGDINTPSTSKSGNLHGMPLAAHLGLFGQREVPGIGFVRGCLRSRQLGFIGVRELDQAEATIIDDRNIPCYTAEDVRQFGMAAVVKQVLAQIDPENKYPLLVSFDVDAADPSVAPATGVPVAKGLMEGDLDILADHLAATGRVAGLDLAEVNPALAATEADLRKTVEATARFAAKCLG